MSEQSSHGVAVITGASAGLGKIYADRLAARGHDLILVARRGDLLEAVAAEVRQAHGVNVQILTADLAIPADLAKVTEILANDATITMLVNNAGVSTLAPLALTTPDQAATMVDVNIAALTALTLAVVPAFKARDRGTIVNIGSVLGFHTFPFSSVYSGTKGYVMNFTRGLQEELADTKVAVQLVMPAATATDIWELSGVPLSNLDPATVMAPADCVDAALAGLERGELFTLPSVEDQALWNAFDAARLALLGGAQSNRPASRYGAAA